MKILNSKLSSSESRTQEYISQLRKSFIFKTLTLGSTFITIPIMIKYLGEQQYGIWSTLLSIVSWIVLFDIGIGNGLRNKISESLAKNSMQEAQNYISTAYVIIGIISIFLFFIILIFSSSISWQNIFNIRVISNSELKKIVHITIFFLFMNFWLSLINQVFNGLQKASFVILNQFLSNCLILIFVSVLYIFYESSLVKLAFLYGFALMVSNVLLSLWFYLNHNELMPRIKYFHLKYIKSITNQGIQFFIIQIAVVVIFTTDKILITQLFGPEYVANYDIVFKLFSIISIVHSLIMAPLWSAYTDAYYRRDIIWIKQTLKYQIKIYPLIVLSVIFLIFTSQSIISLWIGKNVIVDYSLIISMAFFILISTWNNIFAYFVNAINQLDVQIKTSVAAIFLNIPLSIFLVKVLHVGVYGVVLATSISLFLFTIFGTLQVWKILNTDEFTS